MSITTTEIRCPSCGHFFLHRHDTRRGGRTQQYCSHRCRQAAYRERQEHAQTAAFVERLSARLGELIEERSNQQ